jgi:signal transduction histidine kinase/CheY-like chemotaxis protein
VDATGHTLSAAPAARRLRPAAADRMRVMALQTPSVLLGNALGVLLIAAIFWNAAGPARVLPWVGVAALLWVLRLVHWRQLPAAGPQEDGAALRRWRSGWRVRVVSMAAWWGVAVWLFWDAGAPHQRLMLLLIVYSYALGSVQLLAMQPRVFVAFLVVLLVPTIARVALDDGQPWHWQLAGVLTLLFAITLVMGRTHGDALSRALWLKSRTDTLAEQLRQETTQAQEAHRQAEAASRAKTQFLAAASHDLRQPLHAMGLFAETLRHRVRDAEVADLVGSIQASVDALEGLFAELLDLSRLDAGAVSIEPRAVRLETLYARLRLSFEPAALDKGLALGFRGAALWVRADPLALERMLRNLVANAVRYTDAGGVLVSARVRGDRVLLQVWDSGIGVPPAALPRLFEEFYQAHPGRAVSASERRGMGLGLSIVGRLAALCGTRVQVHSREGRGSVFGFELPRAQPASPVVAAASVPAGPVATLQGLHAVVVDDDEAVRQGLCQMLRAWGARVSVFAERPALSAWLASPQAEPPDLVIVDHRLVEPGDGLQALAQLRAAWPGRTIPAVLVTGSLLDAPQWHEALAAVPALHVLRKPVPPGRLRALIGFLVAPSAAPHAPG